MIINKITTGFVIQSFDADIRKFTEQRFTAGDESTWENEQGKTINAPLGDEPYLRFDMIQPYWPPVKHEVVDDVEKFVNRLPEPTPEQI